MKRTNNGAQKYMTKFQNSTFPDDANGDVLRRMLASGDDLSRARIIDFTTVFPDQTSALSFAQFFKLKGYSTDVEHSACVETLPWDVVVKKSMIPEHRAITAFESELESRAGVFGGRNDGWGCFEQK